MRLHLIDGSGYIFRGYHSLPPMERSDGTPIGAVYGYVTMLWRLLKELEVEQPTHTLVAFDAGGAKTFRNDIYPAYKGNRPPIPDSLRAQFPLIRKATEAFGLAQAELEGFEADDLIATYARMAAEDGGEVVIASIDKDFMQLVGGPVSMMKLNLGKEGLRYQKVGYDEVVAKFGVPPERVLDVLAMAGDTSDNIPGVPTIGEKTAVKLISEFGDLDAILENVDALPEKIRDAFRWPATYNVQAKRWKPDPLAEGMTGDEKALLSRRLAALKDDVPVDRSFTFEHRPIDLDRLCEFLTEMEFHALVDEWRAKEAA